MKQFATVTVIGRDKTGVIARGQRLEAGALVKPWNHGEMVAPHERGVIQARLRVGASEPSWATAVAPKLFLK